MTDRSDVRVPTYRIRKRGMWTVWRLRPPRRERGAYRYVVIYRAWTFRAALDRISSMERTLRDMGVR